MRIRLGTLRKVLNEVAVSPSVFKNNKPVRDPMDKPNVAKAAQELEAAFKRNLELNLVLSLADKYNQETSQFDDAAYDKVKQATAAVGEKFLATVNDALEKAWVQAHQEVKGVETSKPKQQAPAGAPS